MPGCPRYLWPLALCVVVLAGETFKGVEFPGRTASFADAAVSCDPAWNAPTAPHQDATQARRGPNYPAGQAPEYVNLGPGGRIVLRFTDNSLAGSGSNALDLRIFEIGRAARRTAF
ncbi:hypothetical protein FG147_02085 [Thauera sp. UPWRP]|nr:hypothetical protein FG147_02085 [Thauera sp. UPWRP]